MQSSSHITTTNKPTSSFLQARCPSCRPTNSVKALEGKISHSMDFLTPSSPGGLPTLSLTTNSSWLPWGGLPCHDEWLVKAVMAMYEGAQTVVRTTEGDSKAFNVKVGLHQGSVLKSLFWLVWLSGRVVREIDLCVCACVVSVVCSAFT